MPIVFGKNVYFLKKIYFAFGVVKTNKIDIIIRVYYLQSVIDMKYPNATSVLTFYYFKLCLFFN